MCLANGTISPTSTLELLLLHLPCCVWALLLLLLQDLASAGRYDEQGNALPISSTIQPGEYVKVGSSAPKSRLC